MFAQIRLILIALSALLFAYGGYLFWSGKSMVEEKRRTARPRVATLDDLALNPPTKSGEWYRITDGVASLPRAVLMDSNGSRGSQAVKNAPFLLFMPVLQGKDAAIPETVARFEERPAVILVVRSRNKTYRETYLSLMQLQSSDPRTTDSWLAQNRETVMIRPPFTGLLMRRDNFGARSAWAGTMNAEFAPHGWILLEGSKPILSDNAELAIGLTLMMGVPTVWLFGLLFAGKLDPPDDEQTVGDHPAGRIAVAAATAPGAFVMPSAMPADAGETDTKTPRR